MKRIAIGAALVVLVTLGTAAPASAMKLHNLQNWNMCLGVSPSNAAIIWDCNGIGQDWQQNWFRSPHSSPFQLVDVNTGLCLGTPYPYYGSGLALRPCWDFNASLANWYYWTESYSRSNPTCFIFSVTGSNTLPGFTKPMVMGVAGATNTSFPAHGTRVITWEVTGETNQWWCPE